MDGKLSLSCKVKIYIFILQYFPSKRKIPNRRRRNAPSGNTVWDQDSIHTAFSQGKAPHCERGHLHLPVGPPGDFAEHVAEPQGVPKYPLVMTFPTTAAILFTGLTARQYLSEKLESTAEQRRDSSPWDGSIPE